MARTSPEAEDINMTFGTLQSQVSEPRPRVGEGAFQDRRCLCHRTDVKHNKRYVGVAGNIWHRLGRRMRRRGDTGHNKGLKEFLTDMENQQSRISYALHYLRFSILESWKVEAKVSPLRAGRVRATGSG